MNYIKNLLIRKHTNFKNHNEVSKYACIGRVTLTTRECQNRDRKKTVLYYTSLANVFNAYAKEIFLFKKLYEC